MSKFLAIMTINKEGEHVQTGSMTEKRINGQRAGYDVHLFDSPNLKMYTEECDPTEEELKYAELLDNANYLVDALTVEEVSIKKVVDTIRRLTELI